MTEPIPTPSQAEGEREPEDVPTEPDRTTPSQAEGEDTEADQAEQTGEAPDAGRTGT